MPIPFERFRLLNERPKRIENVTFQRPLKVKVDDHPEVIVPPGEMAEIPEGAEIVVEAEEVP